MILYLKIFLVSFVLLFLEMLIIRLISAEIRIFAYLSNLVLLTIFIGSGIGILIKKRVSILISNLLLLIIILIITSGIFFNITDFLSPLSESFIWFQNTTASVNNLFLGLLMTIVLLIIIVSVFIPLGQYLGNLLNNNEHAIFIYSLNIFASLFGMWSFYYLTFYNFSPLTGIIIMQILITFLISTKEKAISIFIICISGTILFLNHQGSNNQIFWSEYQKLSISPLEENALMPNGYLLKSNNVAYMGLLDLSEEYKTDIKNKIKNRKLWDYFDIRFENQYDLPYIIKPDSKNVLIIGSGGGNDAAGAVRANIPFIDAVEIDPKIIEIAKHYHPEKPYLNSNVKIIISDGRSYLNSVSKKYDIIIMSLADSHTLSSSLTNLQLDNFLYTKESMQDIIRLLNDEGLLFITFGVTRPWIGERIQNTLTSVLGSRPIIFNLQEEGIFGWGGTVFVNKLNNKDTDLVNFINNRKIEYKENSDILTDDWPYLYLDKPRLPTIHLLIFIILAFIYLLFNKYIKIKGHFQLDAFLLGAGFILFEFHNINITSVIFGNTWINNLFNISSILIYFLIANLIQSKINIPVKRSFTGLFLTFIVLKFLPISSLNALPQIIKFFIGTFIINLPSFFSGLIFINLFSLSKSKNTFYASNILGSAFGGMLSILSYAFGLKILFNISFLLYFVTYIFIIYKRMK